MHMFDLLAIALPLILVVLAYMRGVVTEVVLFLAWAGGIALAKVLFPETHPMMAQTFSNPVIQDLAAFGIVIVPVVLIGRYAVQAVSSEINRSRIGLMNRGLGVALGLLRGIVLAWLLVGVTSWSYMRAAHAAIYQNRTVNSSKLIAQIPLHDILCGQTSGNNLSLVIRLEQRQRSLSSLAREIVLLNKDPKQFPMVQFSREVSAQLCGRS